MRDETSEEDCSSDFDDNEDDCEVSDSEHEDNEDKENTVVVDSDNDDGVSDGKKSSSPKDLNENDFELEGDRKTSVASKKANRRALDELYCNAERVDKVKRQKDTGGLLSKRKQNMVISDSDSDDDLVL